MMEQPPPKTADAPRTSKPARKFAPRTTLPHQPQRYLNVIPTLGKEYGTSRVGRSVTLELCPEVTNIAIPIWFPCGNKLLIRCGNNVLAARCWDLRTSRQNIANNNGKLVANVKR
jgi:hypothetical protein